MDKNEERIRLSERQRVLTAMYDCRMNEYVDMRELKRRLNTMENVENGRKYAFLNDGEIEYIIIAIEFLLKERSVLTVDIEKSLKDIEVYLSKLKDNK